jgi:hypothetical protein
MKGDFAGEAGFSQDCVFTIQDNDDLDEIEFTGFGQITVGVAPGSDNLTWSFPPLALVVLGLVAVDLLGLFGLLLILAQDDCRAS